MKAEASSKALEAYKSVHCIYIPLFDSTGLKYRNNIDKFLVTCFIFSYDCWVSCEHYLFAGFEELHCHCGAEVIYPPVACGTEPPDCVNVCIREHSCDHKGNC